MAQSTVIFLGQTFFKKVSFLIKGIDISRCLKTVAKKNPDWKNYYFSGYPQYFSFLWSTYLGICIAELC